MVCQIGIAISQHLAAIGGAVVSNFFAKLLRIKGSGGNERPDGLGRNR